jgi:acyl transferase domain-containing protein
MDPMQRMLLEVVYESIENAGIPISKLAGSNTGCYVGCFTHDYDELGKHDGETIPKYDITGNGQSILSNRVSFCFDLKGPSMTLDTACSSSLVALHLACQSLKAGESDAVIVGCSNAILSPNNFISMTNLGLLGKDGVSYAFDERANGYARGEGIASIVLKPLASALRDGDTIRGVIRGTAVNSNGRGQGLTMPSKEAQIRLMKTAYGQAGLDFSKTAYVEAHGTGTQAGDPIEAGAIDAVLGPAKRPNNNKVIVGSVKTNIGHLEGASGLAGLIKAVMTIEKGVIAPNIFFEKGNPKMDWENIQITIPTEATPWPVEGLRRVSVNGFGYGGTNGHVVIDDAYNYLKERGLKGNHRTLGFESDDEPAVTENAGSLRSRVFPISGRDATSAKDFHKTLAEYIRSQKLETEAEENTFLDDLSYTLAEHRSSFEHRSVVIAAGKDELLEKLEGTITLARAKEGSSRLAFLFTGQGAQWWGMGRELVNHPTFRKSLEACQKAVQALNSPWDLIGEWKSLPTTNNFESVN